VGAALAFLGYDYNDTNRERHGEVGQLLLDQKRCLAGFISPAAGLATGELAMAQATSVEALLARDENEAIKFVIPQEGSSVWLDYLAIPAASTEGYTAEIFINYLLLAEIAAQNADYSYAFPANSAADAYRDEYYLQLIDEGGLAVDDETWSRLSWIIRNHSTTIFSDTFLSIRGRE
jgi:spermidine/putrescine transport system substrate-binding protein